MVIHVTGYHVRRDSDVQIEVLLSCGSMILIYIKILYFFHQYIIYIDIFS